MARRSCPVVALLTTLVLALFAGLAADPPALLRPPPRALPLLAAAAAAPTGAPGCPPPPPLGAILVYHSRPQAVLEVLRAFRRHYPASHLHLACDDGCHNLTAAAARFGAAHTGPARITSKLPHGTFHLLRAQAHTFVEVLRGALEGMREEFFLWLQTDVLVLQPVASRLAYDLNGYAPDKSIVGGPEKFARKWAPRALPTIPLAGVGGSVMRTSFFRALFSRPDIHALVDDLYNECQFEYRGRWEGDGNKGLGDDFLFSALTAAANGSIGTYSGFIEEHDVRSNYMRMLGTVEVLHGFKALYNAAPTEEDREVLGAHWEARLSAPA